MGTCDVTLERIADRCVISVAGELDIANVDELRQAFASARSEEVTVIEVNLRDVSFIDSTGLHVLFDMRAGAAPARIKFITSHSVDRLLEITGLTAALATQEG